MDPTIFLVVFVLRIKETFVGAVKFTPESLVKIPVLVREGKSLFQSLTEKANVPQFGPCWKNAISDLQIGCKFLSEDVQSDLALKFTDCFFQMSGHEPLMCDTQKSACLRNLSDREFNAYTEFYTHTQSICYFLQSQVWHEETEKTIDKLSSTSMEVSRKLREAEKIQKQLLEQQQKSLHLQNDLVQTSKTVATSLQSSQDKINLIMKDFQDSAKKQKELLNNVFEHLLSFKAFVVDEMSWFNSAVFFIGATILSFLFTSVPRTRGARMLLFIIFTVNFLFERYLTSSSFGNIHFLNNITSSTEYLHFWVWFCRKFCSCLSLVILLYFALNYYDYNLLNYKLLLEIKNQNSKILNNFSSPNDSKLNQSGIAAGTYTNLNAIKCTGLEKSWYQGYENNFLNPNDCFFSSKTGFNMSLINDSNGGFENVDGPTSSSKSIQNSRANGAEDLPATHEDYKIKHNLNDVSITSEGRKNIDCSKRSYDLRGKRKTVYAF